MTKTAPIIARSDPMRCVATIIFTGEGNALRAAAQFKKEKPSDVDMKYEHMKGEQYRIMLFSTNGRELVVQQFVRDLTPNMTGHSGTRYSAA